MKKNTKHMLVAISLAVSSVLLTACSETTSEKTVYTIASAYAAAANLAAQYEQGKMAGLTPDPDIVTDIKTYDTQAYEAVSKLEDEASAGQSISGSELVAGSAAVTALQDYLTAKGIKN